MKISKKERIAYSLMSDKEILKEIDEEFNSLKDRVDVKIKLYIDNEVRKIKNKYFEIIKLKVK